MKPEEEKLKESFKTFLKNNLSSVQVNYKGKRQPVRQFKLESAITLEQLDSTEVNSAKCFRYSVKGWANIGLGDEDLVVIKPMNFSLTIKVNEDSVDSIQDNLIFVLDKC